ncbi:MAG: exodeoxyribonuclease VII large subunit [Bradymonadales bacterium]|jgi:exodeoxyribonuclease VII large subunit
MSQSEFLQYHINEDKKCIFVEKPSNPELFAILSANAMLKFYKGKTKEAFLAQLKDQAELLPFLRYLGFKELKLAQRSVVASDTSAYKANPPTKSSQASAQQNALASTAMNPYGQAQGLSVKALNELIQQQFKTQFSEALWVIGEITDYNQSQRRSGQKGVYFKLIDKEEHAAEASSMLDVVIWNTQWRSIDESLEAAKLGPLKNGLRVRVLLKLNYYVKGGKVSGSIMRIDPNYTLGEFALSKQRVWGQLVALGIAQKNFQLPFPILPKRVALFTRENSQAYIDFVEHLRAQHCACEVKVFDISVQGQELVKSFCSAFDKLIVNQFDLAVLTRGGGSSTDLAQFNEFEIAVRIARSPLKFLVAIGHESDRCVLDEIAEREKTPTAAAQRIINCFKRERDKITRLATELESSSLRHIQKTSHSLDVAAQQIATTSVFFLKIQEHRLEQFSESLANASMRTITRAQNQIDALTDSIAFTQKQSYIYATQKLVLWEQELLRATRDQLSKQKNLLNSAQDVVDAVNPMRLLQRGFSILKKSNGKLVSSIRDLEPNERVQAVLCDGGAVLTVNETSQTKDIPI